MKKKKMKILSPIDRASEVEVLIQAGADEFYCGLTIEGEHFGTTRLSGDIAQYNIPSCAELRTVAEIMLKHKKDLFVVLNYPFWTQDKINNIISLLGFFKEINIKGFIVSSVDLMGRLKEHGFKIIASSLMEVKTPEAVEFLKQVNVKRIILDRQISLADIKNIVPKFPEIEFEVFAFGAGCRSLDCFCHPQLAAAHDRDYIHPCFFPFTVRPQDPFNKSLTAQQHQIIASRLRMPKITCAGCALYFFSKYSVTSLKIVGRGYATQRKVKNIQFIKSALEELERSRLSSTYYKKVKVLFEQYYQNKCSEEFCYYSHF